ncbi:MAG TPA: hypothetical protein VNP96_04355 [Solirubrobacterales bacterium]|nr:hypothetical protein [Solirubrobacterales bacterium]
MPKRRHINAGPKGRALRSKLAAAASPVRDLAGAVEERVLWRIGDLFRAIAEIVRWPFERLAWTVERRVVWPLQERTAGRGVPGRVVGAGALAAVAIGAVAFGAVWASSGESDRGPVASGAPVAAATPAPQPPEAEPTGPALQGVPPKFGVGESVGVAPAPETQETDDAAGDPSAATSAPSPGAEEGAATTSSQKPVSAGPAAMKVARRFSEAFVFYEIGEKPARALSVFDETATPELASALAERPPRLPEGTEVPRARVLNLVPGPRQGDTYTVSASLLRVGATSELRMKMTNLNGTWVVTDVRG